MRSESYLLTPLLPSRRLFLNLAILLVGTLAVRAEVSENTNRWIVMIHGAENGTGLVVGFDDQFVWVLTAKHVIQENISPIVRLYKPAKASALAGGKDTPCQIVDAKNPSGTDLLLLKCDLPAATEWSRPGRSDLLSPLKRIPLSSRVTFSGNLQLGWFSPPSWGLVSQVTSAEILAANTFGIDVTGASGGPLFSEGGEILGIIKEYQREFLNIVTIPWIDIVDLWLKNSGVTLPHPLRTTSRAPLGPDETEVAVSYQNIQVPDFGTLLSPQVRVSRHLPRLGQSFVAFDISGAGDPNLGPA